MERIKLFEIVEAVGGSFGYPGDIDITSVSTDTRTIQPGCVYFAIKGERFDGHDFAAKAMELGAAAVVCERAVAGVRCIIVDSTRQALLDLAHYYRKRFAVNLIGITGSVGKTTTKEMVALAVSAGMKTLKTEGNRNNEIGLPMTLFGLDSSYGAAVIEMGMNHFGEISRLSTTAEPTMAIITNIGYSHIENLGTQENILKAKMEILDGTDYNAPLILNRDDKLLAGIESKRGRKIVFYSAEKTDAEGYATDLVRDETGMDFTVHFPETTIPMRLNCLGTHNVRNALAALCAARELGVDLQAAAQALSRYQPDGLRQNMEKTSTHTFLIDCYNASPDSMKAALEVLSEIKTPAGGASPNGRHIAVLADMLELGKMARTLHKNVGETAAAKVDLLVCYGEQAAHYADGAIKKGMPEENIRHFTAMDEMIAYLKDELTPADVVLFKGSRGMKLETAVEALRKNE